MAKKRRSGDLEQAGLETMAAAFRAIPPVSRGKHGFIDFQQEPKRSGIPRPGEVVETLPKKLKGYFPLGLAISRPADARTAGFKIERLNPNEPFRRFENVIISYNILRKGRPPEPREALYYKSTAVGLETLGTLAEYLAARQLTSTEKNQRHPDSFYQYSQIEGAAGEFEDYRGHVALLDDLEGLGSFGTRLRDLILYHGEMAYHLGLSVREAELGDFQARAAAVRAGGQKGGHKRARLDLENAKTWQGQFVLWLQHEISEGRVKAWWAKAKQRGWRENSIETLCKYVDDRWPEEGFKGTRDRKAQSVRPTLRTLRQIISPRYRQLTAQGA